MLAIKSSLRSSLRSRLSQGGYGSEGEGSSGEEGAERLLRAKAEDPAHPRKHRMEESEGTLHYVEALPDTFLCNLT